MKHIKENEKICVNDILYEGLSTISMENDFLLPDYFPEVMRVLKSSAEVYVSSKTISGDKLIISVTAVFNILYQSEDLKLTNATMKNDYNKTIELRKAGENPVARVKIKTDYCNVRVMNKRRFDIRAAASMDILALDKQHIDVDFTDLDDNMQIKKERVCVDKIVDIVNKQINLKEEIADALPQNIDAIVSLDGSAETTDYKIVSNKLIIKGEVAIKAVFLLEDGRIHRETLRFPYGQIIDLDESDDECSVEITGKVCGCSLNINSTENEAVVPTAEMTVVLECLVKKKHELLVPIDAFNTSYECISHKKTIPFFSDLEVKKDTISVEHKVLSPENLCDILDVSAETKIIGISETENGIVVNAKLDCNVIYSDEMGMADCLQSSVDFSYRLRDGEKDNQFVWDICLCVSDIVAENHADGLRLNAQICLYAVPTSRKYKEIITSIELNQNEIKEKNKKTALKIYFADPGESIFSIAKKYNTSVQSIVDENELLDDVITAKTKLIIPLV